jgi:hypothetical protein
MVAEGMRRLSHLILAVFFFSGLVGIRAWAGPPLATEDPGILQQGQWEVIASTTATGTGSGSFYQMPALDVSLGVLEDYLQISAAYPYVFADPDSTDSDSDFGNLELGVKFRFWNSETLQIAFAPTYSLGITRILAELGIGEDNNVLALPLALEYGINDRLRLNTDIGYAVVDGGTDGWAYGLAMAFVLNERWELLWEFSGASDTNMDNNVLDLRGGFDFAVSEDFHLLFSVATGLVVPDKLDQLDYDIYLGVQWLY